jgi:hypothetical protein
VHRNAVLNVDLRRTLRIPDDGREYPLPPGLGRFPLRHVDDFHHRVPEAWIQHGGVMYPMYQSEAMWIYFHPTRVPDRQVNYPFAIKVATGKIDAVSGAPWSERLRRGPQNYVVAPSQPWLDGYCVEKGIIRQFVAMPLGAGYTAEEQLTGEAEYGGLQLMVFPMKREAFERRFPKQKKRWDDDVRYSLARADGIPAAMELEMGLAPGGLMVQDIYDDPFDLSDWDIENTSRCFVHIANSMVWRMITGQQPPTVPPTAKEYDSHGLPWFTYYDDSQTAVEGSEDLAGLESVSDLGKKKGDVPLPENQSTTADKVIALRKGLTRAQVREGRF